MSAVSVKSLWLADALQDERLAKAIQRLRLKNGDFSGHEAHVKQTGDKKSIRMFYVEGPRGGVHGILLARRPQIRGGVTRIGVYVDRKSRRRSIGRSLVEAARSYYPSAVLRGTAWNDASLEFWNKVTPIVGREPARYFMGV